MAYCLSPHRGTKEKRMAAKTCAACDYQLDENAIKVNIGGKTVEVCCDECAQKLKKTASSAPAGQTRV